MPPTEGNTAIVLNRVDLLDRSNLCGPSKEDILNPIVIGPVVPTGGLSDLTPPLNLRMSLRLIRLMMMEEELPFLGRKLADDCTFYAVWVKLDDGQLTP